MNLHSRQQEILGLVRGAGSISIHQLVERLGASPATVRRDLVALEEAGKLIRTHGAVMDPRNLSGEPSFSVKRERIPAVKRRIGQAVADQIPEGASVFVDAGTTCLEAGMALMERGGCSLYTNSLPLLYNAEKADTPLVGIGGQLRAISGAMVGALALDWLRHLRFDYAVLGASGLHPEDGALTTESLEAGVKQMVIERSKQSILAADSDKLNQSASVRIADWSAFDVWVCDAAVPSALRRKLKAVKGFSLKIID